MKDEILSVLNMKMILNKYGIQINRDMCHCPFHKDKSPSMKVYDKSFYCFSCNRTGDLIEFVKQYFNLNFQEAMEKINFDFNLGLKTRGRMSKAKLIQIRKQQELLKQQEEMQEKIMNQKISKACKINLIYKGILESLKKEITIENWEEKTETISFLQEKIEINDIYIDDMINKKLEM